MPDLVEEQMFLRPVVIRLRGILPFSDVPEVMTVLREVISTAEDRLAALDAAKLRDGGYRAPG